MKDESVRFTSDSSQVSKTVIECLKIHCHESLHTEGLIYPKSRIKMGKWHLSMVGQMNDLLSGMH